MQTSYQTQAKKRLLTIFVSIVIIAGVVLYADHLKSSGVASVSTSAALAPTTPALPAAATPATTSTASSPAVSYTASSSYYVPRGNESIQVMLTISAGTVINASIQNSASDRTSASYQQDFATIYKNFVIGKKINDLQLDVVAGASDTTQGFNDALKQIANKVQA